MGVLLLIRYLGLFLATVLFFITLVGVYLLIVPHEYLHGFIMTVIGLLGVVLSGMLMAWAARSFLRC